MANRQYNQFLFSLNPMLTYIQGTATIGASGGAVINLEGSGIDSMTLLSAGTYSIKFQDNYNKFLGFSFNMQSPTTGGSVNDGSFVVGTTYEIENPGTTTDWYAAGLSSDFVPTAGQSFVATSIGGAGDGTALAIGDTDIAAVEICGDPDVMVNPRLGQGAELIIQCIGVSGLPASPPEGTDFDFSVMFRNSSLKGKGEV